MKTNLQKNLTFEMERQGISFNKLADLSGVSQPTISRIISGESKDPRRSNVEKLAEALGVSVLYLTGESTNTNSEAANYNEQGSLTETAHILLIDEIENRLNNSISEEGVRSVLDEFIKTGVYKLSVEDIYTYWDEKLSGLSIKSIRRRNHLAAR